MKLDLGRERILFLYSNATLQDIYVSYRSLNRGPTLRRSWFVLRESLTAKLREGWTMKLDLGNKMKLYAILDEQLRPVYVNFLGRLFEAYFFSTIDDGILSPILKSLEEVGP